MADDMAQLLEVPSTAHLFFCFVTLFSGAQSSVGTHNASKHQGPGDWGQVFFCVCHSLQVSDLNVQCLKGAATAQRFALPPHVNSSAPIMTIAYACETHSCSACAAVTETHSPGAFYRYGLELLGIIARKHWARLPPDNYPQVTAMHLYTLKCAVAIACLVSSSHWCFLFQLIAAFGEVIRILKPAADTRSVIDKLSQVHTLFTLLPQFTHQLAVPLSGGGRCRFCRMASCLAQFSV